MLDRERPLPHADPTVIQLRVGQRRQAPEPQRAAAASAAPPLRHETCQSTAAHTADCELGSATEDSQSCPRRPPPKGPRGRAPDAAARYTAAHPPRHSYTADHLARTPLAPPLLRHDAFGSFDFVSGYRVWVGRPSRAQARADRVPKDHARTDRASRVRARADRVRSARMARSRARMTRMARMARSARMAHGWRGCRWRGWRGLRGCHASRAARGSAHCEAFFRQLALIRFEPAPEQSHQVAIGQSMRREPADALQQLAKLTIYREMHSVSIRGQRFESA